jgi:hypothetical protein
MNLKNKKVIVQPIFYIYRRILVALIITLMRDLPVFAAIAMNFLILVSLILMGQIEPFRMKFILYIELANQFLFLVVNYHILCLSNFVEDST